MADTGSIKTCAVIITEADGKVATGYLMESIVLAAELVRRGIYDRLIVNDDMDDNLKKQIPLAYGTYNRENISDLTEQVTIADIIITDLREINNEKINDMKAVANAPSFV